MAVPKPVVNNVIVPPKPADLGRTSTADSSQLTERFAYLEAVIGTYTKCLVLRTVVICVQISFLSPWLLRDAENETRASSLSTYTEVDFANVLFWQL